MNCTGWTSFTVCGKLRRLTKVKKVVCPFSICYAPCCASFVYGVLSSNKYLIQVGHAGTLDPMATGLLIVCIGKATKLADKLVFKQNNAFSVVYFWSYQFCGFFDRHWAIKHVPEL